MNYEFVAKTALFQGYSAQDIKQIEQYLHLTVRRYRRRDVIYRSGSTVEEIGVVLSGSVQIDNNDIWGNRTILNIVGQGGAFAESYACIPGEPLLVNVVANEDCEILFVNVPRLFATSDVPCHGRLIQNLLMTAARQNLHLSQRIFLTSAKSIRGRLTAYFSQQIALQGSNRIQIPFNRQQLADYLNVERSALSKELGKMRADGLLDFHKNHFEIRVDPMKDR